ncbi:class II fructose-bisphosphate aldolase [Marispirochaeta sp.]|uniref:class II fructose-bisphosphate aldolase n=1 Tax=Marispirochaeta sp. TaxID=2038653 RepID=UPI0037480528
MNVDALAVAVGTAHGLYKAEPEIQQDLISSIASETGTPLVLHGATGGSRRSDS